MNDITDALKELSPLVTPTIWVFVGISLLAFIASMIFLVTKKRKILNFFYTIFMTVVSIFPLLGMLGTVLSLLNLNFDNIENMQETQKQFINALNTTALGLIFSIVFKFINSFFQSGIEKVIDEEK